MDSSSKSPSLSPNTSSSNAMPTFVFRLVNFDINGNKLGKRKYGYAAKTGLGNDLDETVYQGIISRAEQAFGLRPKQYHVYLILSGKRTKELGESDINAGSPFRIADFEGFKTYRNLMAAVQLDPKNRKVVNLCVVPLNFDFKKSQTVPLAIDGKVGDAAAAAPRVEAAASNVTAKSPSSPPLNRDRVTDIFDNGRRQSQAQAKAWSEDQAMLKAMKGAENPPKYAQAAAPVKQAEMPGAMPGMQAAPIAPVKQEPTVNPQDTLLKPANGQAASPPKVPIVPKPHAQPVFGRPGFAPYAPQGLQPGPHHGFSLPPLPPQLQELQKQQQANFAALQARDAQAAKANEARVAQRHAAIEQKVKAMKAAAAGASVPSWPDWTRATAAAGPFQPKQASPFAAAAAAPKAAAAPARKPAEKPATAEYTPVTNVHPCAYTQPSQGTQAFYDYAVANKGAPAFSGWGTKPAQPVSTKTVEWEPVRKHKPFDGGICRVHTHPSKPVEAATAPKPAAPEQKKAFQGLVPLMEKFVNDFNKTMAEEAGDLPPIKLAVENKSASTIDAPVLTGEGEKEMMFGWKGPNFFDPTQREKEVKHKATCDVCSKWIIGVRHKCLDCPDWDCCEKCFSNIKQAHPDHSFALIRKQGDIVWKSDLGSDRRSVQHYGVHCDSCNKPIYDIRYKCTHADCPDFDLCAECEADPVPYAQGRKIGAHDYSSHYMLKIRKPVSQFSAGKTIREAIQQAIKNAQEIAFGLAPPAVTGANAMELPAGLHSIPGSNDKTLIVDVDIPYTMLNGKKEISISLDLGENEKGETVIIGPSAAAQASSPVDDVKTEVKAKVDDEVTPVKIEESKVETPVKIEEAVQENKSSEVKVEADVLNATWVEDVTFDDGTAVTPGAVFNKIWKIKNTGSVAWPAGCQLIRVSGVGKSDAQDAAFDLPEVAAGESVNVVAKNVTAPDMPGKFMVYYRFVGPDGTTRFGDRLWLDVNVEEEEGTLAKSRNASEHSLQSSSIVAPTLSAKNSANYEDISAFTSPRTAPSELPESEGFTAGSVNGEDDDDDDFVLLSDGDDNFAEIDSVTSSKN